MNKFLKILGKEPYFQILLVIFFVTVSFCAAATFRNYFSIQTQKALNPLENAYKLNKELLKEQKLSNDSMNVSILMNKVEILEQKKEHNKHIFTKISSYYYAAVTLLPFLSGILVVITFLVAQKGWSNCSSTMKSLFLTFALLSAWYAVFPTIYQQEKTMGKNMSTYIELSKLQSNIFDYALTHPILYGDTLQSKEFLDIINKKELELQNISFSLELKSLDESILSGIQE